MHDLDSYTHISVTVDSGVAVAVIDAPPINVMVTALYRDLIKLSYDIGAEDSVRVLVLRSADPDFFIAHFDVESILSFDTTAPAVPDDAPNPFHEMCERFRTGSTITIAEIDGRVGGGGAELAASFDMRFGSIEFFTLCQMEVPLGILPGGSGTQRLPRLVGSGRAMEIVLGGIDVDARTAESWGWLNRALPSSELRSHVAALSRRIAAAPPKAVELAKQCVLAAESMPLAEGLRAESAAFQQTLRDPRSTTAMEAFMDQGGQTRSGEREIQPLLDKLTTDR